MNAVNEPTSPVAASDPYTSRVLGHATLVPRRDPVVYSPNRPGSPLTQEQLRSYEQNGFLILESLFSPSEIGALRQELSRLQDSQRGIDPRTLVLEPDSRELRSIFQVHVASEVFAHLARSARLVSLASWLLGDRVYVHQSRLNYKPGFMGKDFYWHSDFETWHMEDGMPRMRALSVSIALTENTEFNGPLMLIPRSHRQYVTCVGETPAEHYKQSLRKQEYGVPDPASVQRLVADGGLVASKGPPGTVTLFDCNVMHGSNSNISPYPRSNVFIVYNAMGNRLLEPFGGQAPRPEFIAARTDVLSIEPRAGRLV